MADDLQLMNLGSMIMIVKNVTMSLIYTKILLCRQFNR